MKLFSLITGAIAATTLQNASSLPVRETTTSISNVANSDNMPSGSADLPFQTTSSVERSEFLENLLSQKQDLGMQEPDWAQNPEQHIRGLMKEYAPHAFPLRHREAWLATRSRADLAILQAAGVSGVNVVRSEVEKDLLYTHYNLIQKIELEEVNKVVDEAGAVQKKFDPYIVCENLHTNDQITMKAIYANKDQHKMETTVTCDGSSFKIVKIPKEAREAKDLQVLESINGGAYREVHRSGSGDYRSSKGWRSSSPSSVRELAEEKMGDLDKLIESGDTQAVIDYANDMIRAFGKKDRTGAYKAALSARSAALQAAEDLDTAQRWFDITEAAKQRAKAARAWQRGSEL